MSDAYIIPDISRQFRTKDRFIRFTQRKTTNTFLWLEGQWRATSLPPDGQSCWFGPFKQSACKHGGGLLLEAGMRQWCKRASRKQRNAIKKTFVSIYTTVYNCICGIECCRWWSRRSERWLFFSFFEQEETFHGEIQGFNVHTLWRLVENDNVVKILKVSSNNYEGASGRCESTSWSFSSYMKILVWAASRPEQNTIWERSI